MKWSGVDKPKDSQVPWNPWPRAGSAPLLKMPEVGPEVPRYCVQKQDHGIAEILDRTLIEQCAPQLIVAKRSALELLIRNLNRTVGTMLSSQVSKKWSGWIACRHHHDRSTDRPASRSARFSARGITLIPRGRWSNDISAGPSGGKIIVFPPKNAITHRKKLFSSATRRCMAAPRVKPIFTGHGR